VWGYTRRPHSLHSPLSPLLYTSSEPQNSPTSATALLTCALAGPAEFCADAGGWVEPAAAPAGGKKKKGGGGGAANGAANGAAANGAADGSPAPSAATTADAEADPVKAAKAAERKAAKLAEKEAKKARADAKAAKAAADAAARAAGGGAAAKRASKRAEADAKRAAEAAEAEAWVAAARATPAGARKAVGREMPKAYAPRAVEAGWYAWWEASGLFKPASDADPATTKAPFAMVIPPPNVTGSLHIGHALTNAIEDAVARWRRMSGRDVLWLPGTDHAGIATQTVVEKKVARERGATRHDLGREAFLEEVWAYVHEYGGRICEQQRRLGCSVDWSRYAFTMDEARSAAVREAFLKLHAKGLVYRDNRLVNWCCRLRTAVSDIEVDYVDVPRRALLSVPGHEGLVEFGVLTSFAYPLEGGAAGEELVVATTRPETMFGDAAVAVHPDDPRYKHLVGRRVVHPVNGRLLPVITDAELVDMSFGTGAVKITPAHDPNDFATGKRHGLEFYTILDDEGRINGNGTGAFAGQGRFTARATIVDFLKEKGLFRGTADNPMRLGLCSRSKDVIEPVLKPQWWVACGGMAAAAAAAARDGRLEVLPKEHEATWHRWLEGIRDWCVSRQLWWGHRIPAFYVCLGDEAEGERGAPGAPSERMDRWVVAADEAAARAEAEARFPGRPVELSQDEDVLDTWCVGRVICGFIFLIAARVH
jgi:valyl-tRNA synthetase